MELYVYCSLYSYIWRGQGQFTFIINILITIFHFTGANLDFDRLSECTVPNCDISAILHKGLCWISSSLCQCAERKMVNLTLQFPCGLKSWQHLSSVYSVVNPRKEFNQDSSSIGSAHETVFFTVEK